ncbi:hypothetical protein C5167_018774 [Papaver somniferum]|uniref:Uncharacterized protein n=1 Tax=Papaver somniferum TaxID=3469 RepID=A0A4Y7IQE5_PAPSO|nr:hypothetical protein C5167_018774 [Papaver somniferum]
MASHSSSKSLHQFLSPKDLFIANWIEMFHYDPKASIPPTQTLDSTTNKLIPNPEYLKWVKHDKFILDQMCRETPAPIWSEISGCKTSREVWNYLQKSYFDEQYVKVAQLRHKLLTLQKVSEDDLVRFAIGGLCHRYDVLVGDILAKPVLPTLNELRWRLIVYMEIHYEDVY